MTSNRDSTIRWGVISTGAIAKDFAEALSILPDAEITAVGSRSINTSKAFAEKYNITNAYASYEELANDPNVDVVYIGTPHTFHKENVLMCLNAGKAVLCEKPFTINSKEAIEIISLARNKKLFLMEAMWTRFFPVMYKLRGLVDSGIIGELKLLTADFGFKAKFDPEGRLFNRELGGGALLDIGVYTVSLASMLFGKPSSVSASATIGETGVDYQSAAILGYQNSGLAVLGCSLIIDSTQEANIIGTNGSIRIHKPFWRPSVFTITTDDKEEVVNIPYEGNGMVHEAVEVMNCLRSDKTESNIMPLNESMEIMKTLDMIRSEWDMKYPND